MAGVSHGRGGAVPADPIVTLLTVNKAATVNGTGSVGDTIDYTITVSNAGQTDVENVIISDPKVPTLTPPGPYTVPSGQTQIVTGAYTITAADIAAGEVSNTATVTGTNNGAPVGPFTSGPVVTTGLGPPPAPSVSLAKTSAVAGAGSAGDVVTYTVVATNNGTGPAAGVTITDPNVTLTPAGPYDIPANGGQVTVTGAYTITQPDIDAQSISNSVTAVVPGQFPNPSAGPIIVGPPDMAAANGQISVAKTAVVGGAGGVGDVITYTITVNNTGNVTMTNLSVSDPLVGALTPPPPASLAPSAQYVATGTYTITQADINGGGVVANTVTANATDPAGNPRTATAGPINTNVTAPVSDLQLTKSAVSNGAGNVGDTITYTVTVTNNGTIPVSGVAVSDDKVTLAPAGPFNLAPAGVQATTGTYTLTQADLDAGQVQNTATAQGLDPGGAAVGPVTAGPIATSTAAPAPSIAVTKVGAITAPGGVGDTVNYRIVITNDGNQTLQGIVPTDATLGALTLDAAASSGTPGSLGVGQDVEYTGSRTITLADITAQSLVNSVSVAFQNPSGAAQTPVTATETLNASDGLQPPDTNVPLLTGCPAGTQVFVIGEPIVAFNVASNEDVTWTSSNLPAGLTGAVVNARTYRISGTPSAAGTGTLTVTATDDQTNAAVCSVSYVAEARPTVTGGCPTAAQQWVLNTAITPFTLTTAATGGTWGVTAGTLPAGVILNPATGQVSGTPTTLTGSGPVAIAYTTGNGTIGAACTFTRSVIGTAALTVDKTISGATRSGVATSAPYQPGDIVSYQVTVSNDGDLPVTGITITDPNVTLANAGPFDLAVGANNNATPATGTYTVAVADAVAGNVTNTATANGTAATGPVSGSDTVFQAAEPPLASISLTKVVAASTPLDIDEIASPPGSLTPNPFPNDVMSYNPDVPVNISQIDVVLTNNSGGPLSPTLSIVGQSSGATVATANPSTALAAGATAVVSYPMNVDLQPAALGGYRLELSNTADLKFYTNTAGLGRPDLGYFSQGTSPVSPDPEIRISGTFLNTAQPFAEGSTLVYVLTATNDGAQDLGNVAITDPLGAVAGGVTAILAPGAELVATVTHTVTNAEATAGVINNTATVNSTATIGPDTPTDTATLATQVAVPPTITNCPAAPLAPAGGTVITMTADRAVIWSWDDNPNSGLSLTAATGAISGVLNAIADGRVIRVTATDGTTGLTDVCDITVETPAPELTLTNLRITEARNPVEWDTRNTFDGAQVAHTVDSPTFTAPFDMVLTRVQLFALLSANGVATRSLEVRDGIGNNGTTLGVSTNTQPINGPNIKGLKTWNFAPISLSAGQTVTFRANGLGPTAFWFVDPGNAEPQFSMISGSGEFEGRVNGFEIDTTGPFNGPYGPGIQLNYAVDIENTGPEAVSSVAVALAGGETFTDAPVSMTPGQTATATVIHTITEAEGAAGSVDSTAQATATGDISGTAGGPFDSNTVSTPALPAPIITGCPTGTVAAVNGQTYTPAAPLLALTANEAGTWGQLAGPLGLTINNNGQMVGTQFGVGNFATIIEFTSAVSGLSARCSFTVNVTTP